MTNALERICSNITKQLKDICASCPKLVVRQTERQIYKLILSDIDKANN